MLKTENSSKKMLFRLIYWMLFVTSANVGAQSTTPNQGQLEVDQPQLIELENINSSLDKTENTSSLSKETGAKLRCIPEQSVHDWIDGVRVSTHNRLCRTALWIDSRFGDEHEFDDRDFRGKISVGLRQDQKDGFDPRLRVRIKTNLPNVSSSMNAFVGRVEEDSYISNTETDDKRVNAVGLRSSSDDEAEWLIGLGYQKPGSRENGFDYSVGAKLSHGLSPYAKVTHRRLFKPSDLSFWRTTQTGFWRRDDGFGVSSRLDYTKLLSDRDIFEWDTSLKYTEDSEQWEWITGTRWHHSFSEKQGISSRIYVRGEEKNEVAIPEYGVTFTYVRPFLKPWMYIETGIDLRFEKDFRDSSYESVIRFGIEIEMLLGDFYGREKG